MADQKSSSSRGVSYRGSNRPVQCLRASLVLYYYYQSLIVSYDY
ncbi:MAG: hypothetical protein WCF03_11660 [Nitrososphaeraceae archaeon]